MGGPLMLGLSILRTEGGDEGRALPMDLVWGDPWCWGLQYSEPRVEMKVLGTEGAAWGPRCNALLEKLGSWEVLGTEGGARGGPKCKEKKGPPRWLNSTEHLGFHANKSLCQGAVTRNLLCTSLEWEILLGGVISNNKGNFSSEIFCLGQYLK